VNKPSKLRYNIYAIETPPKNKVTFLLLTSFKIKYSQGFNVLHQLSTY
jgi:hypothetical protein